MSKYARQAINRLSAYMPGEQPRPGEKVIKLNTNENPYPPAPGVQKALSHFSYELLRKYPQPASDAFRKAASEVFGIKPSMIFAGNGSDELIGIIVRTFVDAGEAIAYPTPTYTYYPGQAYIQGARVIEVPFGKDFQIPVQLARVKAKVIFIANPNAPTGTFIAPKEIEKFAQKTKGVVVVDEAYADFCDANCLALTKRLSNLIVIRTLSKSYSLAGLRFGFAVASEPLIADMMKVKDSYNCDAISIAMACEAIRDQAYLRKNVEKIRTQRAWLTDQLRRLRFTVGDSQTNFIWARIQRPSAKEIYLALKAGGILVRYFDKPGLRDGLRITVGRAEENRALIRAIMRILNEQQT